MNLLESNVRIHNGRQASFSEKMPADYPEEMTIFIVTMPFINQKLTSYIILLFPCRNGFNKEFPSFGADPNIMSQCLLIFPNKLKKQLADIFSDILSNLEPSLMGWTIIFRFFRIVLIRRMLFLT